MPLPTLSLTTACAALLLSPSPASAAQLETSGSFGREHFRRSASCAPLQDQGTHFTVEVGIGTPPQKFDVVADTGSNSLIVTSCYCVEIERCGRENRCFRGTGKSETFSLPDYDPNSQKEPTLHQVRIDFVSGPVVAAISSDVVTLGEESGRIDNGVLLMLDQALNFDGKMEGIMGLGLPSDAPPKEEEASLAEMCERKGDGKPADQSGNQSRARQYEGKSVLEAFGTSRFSMCVNAGGEGVLRLNGPQGQLSVASIGQMHWGMDFRGVSVTPSKSSTPAASAPPLSLASASSPNAAPFTAMPRRAAFCGTDSMMPGQLSPCGAIPDSGSSFIMGPPGQLEELLSLICDSWPRCQEFRDADRHAGSLALQQVLLKCDEWLKDNLDEMPVLTFHFADKGGEEKSLDIGPATYVTVGLENTMHLAQSFLPDIVPPDFLPPAQGQQKVCSAGFASLNYGTKDNGPVWVLGGPLFYEFEVGYNFESNPRTITFSSVPCGSCSAGGAAPAPAAEGGLGSGSALLEAKTATGRRAGARLPRPMVGAPRLPNIDTSSPL